MRLFVQSTAHCKSLACSDRNLLRKTDLVQSVVSGSSVFTGEEAPQVNIQTEAGVLESYV